ncbi:beta-eliminating lyase-related protein [Streptomyces sp. NBC_01808]|uniref:threonine aldolase family protein n=1 Tax=Streptomyces sp. NBC_01808 TaxID=2975947 RepID=UPI002DDC2BB1|nr:beta-eliminating lyase-related protein [Streptomyces sp. NBC_01808]WSA39423.1 beta-eliminating lyase-related protein [Streptomyces sp. NBC_01808]
MTDADDLMTRRRATWAAAEHTLSASLPTISARLARLATARPGGVDLGQQVDVYAGGIVGELEERTAELLGCEDAAFFPTGTMAQQVALRCWAERTGSRVVASHPMAHLEVHERAAYAVVTGLRTVHPTRAPRVATAAEVRALGEPFGTLMLELPMREPGFVLPEWEELEEVVAAAREREAVVHFDGARLWECTMHFGRGLAEIAGLADSVYVSFYKSLGGLSGAALAGPAGFVEEARAWRHRYGGQVFQQWPAALTALEGLQRELPRLPSYVAHARVVAGALREGFAGAGVPFFRVHPGVPHTHQFQVWLPYGAEALMDAGTALAEETGTCLFRMWTEPGDPPGLSVTEVTVTEPGLAWSAEDVAREAAALVERVRRVEAAGTAEVPETEGAAETERAGAEAAAPGPEPADPAVSN